MVVAWSLLDFENRSASNFEFDTTGLVAGDGAVMVVHNGQNKSGSIAPDEPGWTEAFAPIAGWGNDITLSCWYRHLTAAPPATYGVTWSGGINSMGGLLRVTGHDPANMFEASATRIQASSSPYSPAITTTLDDTGILRLLSHQRNAQTEDVPPTGHTNLYFKDGSSWLGAGGAAHINQASPGSTGNATWLMASNGSYASATVGINSGAAPTGGKVPLYQGGAVGVIPQ